MKDQKEVMQVLEQWGVPIQETMERFLNDEEFYMECLQDFMQDGNMQVLETALRAKDYSAAFDASHTLKGVAGNLGLLPLLNVIVEIVEPLRRKEYDNLEEEYQNIQKIMNELREKIGA
ncbi:MAG: Hpt domain-containing protein [Lachnospiraceae bacterium]|nr:Hpt domain-containing protein [Lachnospiraceae bacterium]